MRLPKGVLPTAVLAFSVVLSACSGTTTPSDAGTPSATNSPNGALEVALVNYELVADTPNRFMVGLILPDNRMVAYGTVQMRFQSLDVSGRPTGSVSEVVTGTYLAVPGTDPGDPETDPQAITPAKARGIYELEGVRFGGPGRWVVQVAARVQGVGVVQGSATFDVLEAPNVPGVGEPAPASENAVIGDPGVDPVSIDSRAQDGSRIPDPELHQVSIADAIVSKRPPSSCSPRPCSA